MQYLIILGLFLLISLCPLPAWANSYLDFEQQVLEIIRQNPEVILESLQTYQYKQQQQVKQAQQTFAQNLITQPETIVGISPRIGTLKNRAVLLEFSDFQCPYCAIAHETVEQFVAKYPDRVTLVYKHFPLSSIHPQALEAAKASTAAQQQEKFWPYHDALFEHQNQLGEDFYLETAHSLNLDIEKFNQDRAQAMDLIQQDIDLAVQLGIRGTPFFFFQGQIFSGAVPYEEFEKLL